MSTRDYYGILWVASGGAAIFLLVAATLTNDIVYYILGLWELVVWAQFSVLIELKKHDECPAWGCCS